MTKKVIVSPRATKDLEKITEYLVENWDLKVVDDFLKRYKECLDLIVKNPELYAVTRRDKKIRSCVLTKHNMIYFKEFPDRITILTVFDTRQNPKKLNKIL
jgi:plasmid stabilization system protein ParE